jgi:hypothetical protein
MSETMPESGVTSWLDSLEQYGGGFPIPGMWVEPEPDPEPPSWSTKFLPGCPLVGVTIVEEGAVAAPYLTLSIVRASSALPMFTFPLE